LQFLPDNPKEAAKGRARANLSTSGVATILFILIAGLAFVNYSYVFVMTAVAAGIVLLPFSPVLTMLFYAGLLVFAVPINDTPIMVAGFRFYVADFAFYLLGCVAGYALWNALARRGQSSTKRSRLERWIIALVVLNLIWGFVEIANGIFGDNLGIRDAIGDFRRIYLYMLAILIPIGLPMKQPLLRQMPYVFVAGGTSAVCFGLYRMASGVLYHSYTSHVDSPRILGDAELVALGFLLAYVIAVEIGKANPLKKMVFLPFGAAAIAFMVISGWRYGIVLAVGVPIGVDLVFAFIKGAMRVRRIVWGTIAAAVVAALGVVAVFGFFGDTANYIWQARRARQQDLQGDARLSAYATALNEFAQKPVLGTGLGDQLSYFAVASDGSLLNRQTTTHNMFIDILYQTGIIGFALFLALHACFVLLFVRNIRHIESDDLAVVVALFVGYVFTLGLFCLEPSYVSTTMAMNLTIGFAVRILRDRSVDGTTLQPASLS
jgi:O-antigen ligase